jgi:hypothetical protein
MSNQSKNPQNDLFSTSKRSKDYRAKKREKGFRTVSYLLHEQTIEKIKELKDYLQITQTEVITKSVEQLHDTRNRQGTSQDTTSSHTSGNLEIIVKNLQREIDYKDKELEEKNHHIRSLIQSQLEANKIVGAFQVKMGYLEEKKPKEKAYAYPEHTHQEQDLDDDYSPKKERKFKKSGKKKKKKK